MESGLVPALGNWYVLGWSVVNLVMLVLVVAVPVICLLLLLKINRRLRRLEQRVVDIQVRDINVQ